MVILDGNLLGVERGLGGELELAPRDHVQRSFSYGSGAYPRRETCVHILTLEALPAFLEKVVKAEREASDLVQQAYLRMRASNE